MIQVKDKTQCCGCAACVQVCPKQCISLKEDSEGFYYPVVDLDFCVNCGLCEKVCPYLNKKEPVQLANVYAVVNEDELVRMQSSSGGAFSILASKIIKDGGVVFAAHFDKKWDVVHDYVEKIEELFEYRGSKYVQSYIGDMYSKVKQFLTSGRLVLFSGTPCQIAGLKLFLRKDYNNLLTVECVCHGVPSVGLWRQFLKEYTEKAGYQVGDILSINFRDKISGWKNYNFTIQYRDKKVQSIYHGDNPWMRSYIKNYNIRPSCFNCPAKCYNSYSDITLGDFWGADSILPGKNDNRGMSLAIYHTDLGKQFIELLDGIECKFEDVLLYNKALVNCTCPNNRRNAFFLQAKSNFIKTVNKMTKDSLLLRIKLRVAKLIGKK